MNGGGAEREGDRIQSRLQALSCQHRARRGAQTHRPQDRDLSRSWPLNRLSHPGTPVIELLEDYLELVNYFLLSFDMKFIN